MSETTARLGLPLLAVGQAQKEVTHNEALAALDLAVAPGVVTAGLTTPPADPAEGACWIVGAGATGAWAGADAALAGWTGGGWRFVAPRAGMLAWVEDAGRYARFDGIAWVPRAPLGDPLPAIAVPAGGSVADAEARNALAAIIATLQELGLIAAD